MFAEMTPGSHHPLAAAEREIGRKGCERYRQLKKRSERSPGFTPPNPKNQRQSKAARMPRTFLKFHSRDNTKTGPREPPGEPAVGGMEGRLRELTSKWFIETQVPLIVHNGFLPAWFLGFISRKDSEEILKEKQLGCFLIRLSDKSIGYILSYKGMDRCRHFVINQSKSGQLVVCGDSEGHGTLPDLIEYFKKHPIQPFGECLSCSCFEEVNAELYDIINVTTKLKHEVADRAWQRQQCQTSSERLPTRPPRTHRTSEVIPPLPRRTRPLEIGALANQDGCLYAQVKKHSSYVPHISRDNCPGRTERSWAHRHARHKDNITRRRPDSGLTPACFESSLLPDLKSKSLPQLDIGSDDEQSYQLSASPLTPPKLSPNPLRQAISSVPPSPSSRNDVHSPVYHLAGGPDSPHFAPEIRTFTAGQKSGYLYAEVSTGSSASGLPDEDAYEQVPGLGGRETIGVSGNTYEPLERLRPRKILSFWGIKTEKWRWLFPEARRK